MLRPQNKRKSLITNEGPGMFNKTKAKRKRKEKNELNLHTELNRQSTAEYQVSELHEMVRQGDISAVISYLDNNPEHLNLLDSNGATPACLAAQRNELTMLEMLAARDGIDLSINDLDGNTPLSWAETHSNSAMITLISKVQTSRCLSDDCKPSPIRSSL